MTKIAFFIDGPSTGGGYYHTMNFVKLAKELKFENNSIFFITRSISNFELLKKNGIVSYFFNPNFFQKINLRLSKNRLVGKLFELINYHNPFYQFLKKCKIDYTIFNEPSYFILYCKNVKFVSYIFNTEIDEVSHFKEFQNGIYERQKKIILFSINYADKIFVFTEKNKMDLIKKYNCDNSKILIQNLIPYLPEVYKNNIQINYEKIFRNKLKLNNDKTFIFYPAQFWEHKNHKLILGIIKHLKDNKNSEINFIFSGADRGIFLKIKKIVKEEGLSEYVNFVGNVSEIELIAIYKYSDFVIMPTFIGRCSLPLLESLYFEKTVFYNEDILDKDFLKYVIGINPKNPEDCFLKIKKFILNKDINKRKTQNLRDVYNQLCNKKTFLNNFQNLLKNI